jgi:hypothetical protein
MNAIAPSTNTMITTHSTINMIQPIIMVPPSVIAAPLPCDYYKAAALSETRLITLVGFRQQRVVAGGLGAGGPGEVAQQERGDQRAADPPGSAFRAAAEEQVAPVLAHGEAEMAGLGQRPQLHRTGPRPYCALLRSVPRPRTGGYER